MVKFIKTKFRKLFFHMIAAMFFLSAVTYGISVNPSPARAAVFTHEGILYSQADFDRAKRMVAAGASPWIESWNAGKGTKFASPNYTPNPVSAPARWGGHPELNSGNGQLFDDSEAALVHAIIWKVSSNATEANNSKLKAQEILDAWSGTVNTVVGGDEKHLLAGLTGYRFAAAADILQSDSTWVNAGKFTRAKNMLVNYFYPALREYLDNHYGKNPDSYPYYYRGNQDTAAMVTIMAIGILTDNLDMYNEAVNEFKNGNHNGRVTHYLIQTSDPNLAQSEESGRDQPHTMLGIGMLATMAQMSYYQNQGDSSFEDLYEYSDRIILKGFEYTAKYNNGDDNVPFTPIYTFDWRNEPVIASGGRGQARPIYEMVWNHYHNVKGLADSVPTDPVYHSRARAALLRPEGIHTDHQPFTTLLYTRWPGAIVSGETYSLRNPKSGKMLDIANNGTADGTNVQIYEDNGSDAQRFTIIDNGDGTYRLIGVTSGKALDVNGGGTADGTNVQIWSYNGGSHQKWRIVFNKDGTYKLIDSHSGKALDVNGAGTANGTNVQIWTDNGGDAQKWELIRNPGIVSGETYELQNPNSVKMLDVYGLGTANGTNVQIWQGTGGENQQWTVIANGDGTYRLIGLQSGKALDVNGAGTADGTNVQIWTYGGGANQKWKFVYTGAGTYKVIDSNSNKVLDVNGSSMGNGTNVQIWEDVGSEGQKWRLILK
ncbi:RICIN domain-containing protein [Paenibacillus tarimensis]